MNILISVGHSILKSGACTSADGRSFGGVLEYAYNKEISKDVVKYLRQAGHTADILICPELQFSRSTEERTYKLPKINKGNYDLVAELHLNASNFHNAQGCEVLYICEKGKVIAQRIQEQLSSVFRSRGIRRRTDLYMLAQTNPVALIVESFFCDSSKDCELAAKTNVARLIAQGIHGGPIAAQPTPDPQGFLYRVQLGAFTVRTNAEQLRNRLNTLGFDAFITTADLGSIFYRVQVGAYRQKSNAEAMQKKLSQAGFSSFLTIA